MKQTARHIALDKLFNDVELSTHIEKGLSKLSNEQFAQAYEAMVNDKALIIKMVDDAKAKHATPAKPVHKAQDIVETDIERTTRILKAKYSKGSDAK